jgi:hypothetical protein
LVASNYDIELKVAIAFKANASSFHREWNLKDKVPSSQKKKLISKIILIREYSTSNLP